MRRNGFPVVALRIPSGAVGDDLRPSTLTFLGQTPFALLITVLVAMAVLGWERFGRAETEEIVGSALGPVCAIILITGAGGAFGGVLRTSGIGDALAESLNAIGLPVIVAAFLIATAVFLYVCMDGFDLGIGILFPWIRGQQERDVAVNTVAPVWDGNETWLIMGGAGLFAVFPLAYATILPALYMPIILMLLALIFRGVSFEMRFRAATPGQVITVNYAAVMRGAGMNLDPILSEGDVIIVPERGLFE